jgi:hypothetical protein
MVSQVLIVFLYILDLRIFLSLTAYNTMHTNMYDRYFFFLFYNVEVFVWRD